MLTELAIGDAYGAGFEYAPEDFVKKNNDLTTYFKHNLEGFLDAGSYTDDTQMTIAIAEMLITREKWTKENLAKRFVDCFKRDPRDSYARAFGQLLKEVKDGDDLLARLKPDSDKSGAAMRTTPLGLIKNLDEGLEKSALQASITHNTFDGINAALAATCLTHYLAYDLGPKAKLVEFIESKVKGSWGPRHVPVKAQGWMSVRAAITAVVEGDSMSSILQKSIAFTGDVDTVATIALGAASNSKEVKQDLPECLVNGLENGTYGRDFLAKLDNNLFDVVGFKRNQQPQRLEPQAGKEEEII